MNQYKTVFISDVHLGTKMSQANKLLDFMKTFESENIYLVGDIIDGWAMNKQFYWPQEHNDVIQKLMRRARKGTKIYYIPGNHDEFLRSFCDHDFGNIKLCVQAIYESVDGRRILITHGDQFDAVITNAKWLAHIGSWAYDLAIVINTAINKIRNLFNLSNWSLSSWLKYKVKEAVNFIGDYEDNLSNYAKNMHAEGVVCGHIHHANIRMIGDIQYLNCGDWVESCTALVEHMDGSFEIIKWDQ